MVAAGMEGSSDSDALGETYNEENDTFILTTVFLLNLLRNFSFSLVRAFTSYGS